MNIIAHIQTPPQIFKKIKIMKVDANSTFENSSIYRLSELKPAGVKLILDPKTDLVELLKLTLFDLTLKKVLVIKKMFKKPHPRDPYLREYTIVETGENFEKYNPNQYEKYFTRRIDKDSYVQLKPYLRAICKEVETESQHKNEIIQNLEILDLFKRDFFLVFFSIFKTNQKGNKLKIAISEYLKDIDRNIANLIEHDPEKSLKLIMFLQGNIFLLKNLKFELIEKLKLVSTAHTTKDKQYFDDWYWFDFMCDFDFNID
jgi:hypothetical protein